MNTRQTNKHFKRLFQKRYARVLSVVTGEIIKPSRVKIKTEIYEDRVVLRIGAHGYELKLKYSIEEVQDVANGSRT